MGRTGGLTDNLASPDCFSPTPTSSLFPQTENSCLSAVSTSEDRNKPYRQPCQCGLGRPSQGPTPRIPQRPTEGVNSSDQELGNPELTVRFPLVPVPNARAGNCRRYETGREMSEERRTLVPPLRTTASEGIVRGSVSGRCDDGGDAPVSPRSESVRRTVCGYGGVICIHPFLIAPHAHERHIEQNAGLGWVESRKVQCRALISDNVPKRSGRVNPSRSAGFLGYTSSHISAGRGTTSSRRDASR